MNDKLEKIRLLCGSGNVKLAKEISKCLNIPLVSVDNTPFPDGEKFIQIHENIRGKDVFILQPTCPPVDENYMELFIIADAARRASAKRITAVIPFYGYARQDRKDRPRVPITAKLMANLITESGVDRVVAMDLHADQIQGFFDIPVDHLFALPAFLQVLKKRKIKDLVVVSPDVGGLKRATLYAKALKAPFAMVAKNRIDASNVEAVSVVGDVKGKNVLIVDDMTETAGTLCAAAEKLKEFGAKQIYAAVSHAVLGDVARERIKKSVIVELFTTNSVPQAEGPKVTAVSVAPLLAEAIRRIHRKESVTSLFYRK
jgi:ribose-phosphate pyrophosphokinase